MQVRSRGTFGGSLVHADPAGDWPAVFLALGGEAKLVGPKGARSVAAGDFFVSMLTSAARPDEVLVEVSLPLGAGRRGSAYRKLRQLGLGLRPRRRCGVGWTSTVAGGSSTPPSA